MSIDLRTSERTTMKRCPQKWYWAYVDGLAPMRSANPLWFGSAVHEALAAWYLEGTKRGPHPAETFSESLEGDRSFLVTNDEEEKEYMDARELGVGMMVHYVDHFGEDESWDVISTEQTFRVWLPHLYKKIKRSTRYVGTFDGVLRDLITGEIFLMEHKTAASINLDHLPLDDQAGSYWAVASNKLRRMGVLKKDEVIAGVRYNFLRKALLDDRPVNDEGLRTNKPVKAHYILALQGVDEWTEAELKKMKLEELESVAAGNHMVVLGDVSKSQPPPYFERHDVYRTAEERRTMIQRIQVEAFYAEQWRSGELPLFKTPTRDCAWQCEFKRMCELHEQGDEGWEEFRDMQFKVRDPYADHPRKSAEG